MNGEKDKVMKLNKSLFGLKQASRVYNKIIDKFLKHVGYFKCRNEHGVYVK